MTGSLFGPDEQQTSLEALPDDAPLAMRLRPSSLREIVGQDHILSEQGVVSNMLRDGALRSMILVGSPGCGKTTLARILARESGRDWHLLNAIETGVKELRSLFERLRGSKRPAPVVFIDEVHRFAKNQQDVLLGEVERGGIILIGATTENPSFSLVNALLSRCLVLTLKPLSTEALEALLVRAEERLERPLPCTQEARQYLVSLADSDGRQLLNAAEHVFRASDGSELLDVAAIEALVQKTTHRYDRDGDQHYQLISALHKAVRSSDPDASLYWLCRMLQSGEDPRYLGRRMVRMANEDIGMADPRAMEQAEAAVRVWERLGSPEGDLALAQAVIYLALAPKSNAVYTAYKAAMASARKTGSTPPRPYSVNAATSWMKSEGFGQDYRYDHDADDGYAGQNHFPVDMAHQRFYHPVDRGLEGRVAERLTWLLRGRNQE